MDHMKRGGRGICLESSTSPSSKHSMGISFSSYFFEVQEGMDHMKRGGKGDFLDFFDSLNFQSSS